MLGDSGRLNQPHRSAQAGRPPGVVVRIIHDGLPATIRAENGELSVTVGLCPATTTAGIPAYAYSQ